MYFKRKIFVLASVLLFVCQPVSSQLSDYRAELGWLGGAAYYIGDANLIPFGNTSFDYGVYFRYCFNTRFAARAQLSRTTALRGGQDPTTFSHPVTMWDLCGEFNFFDYERNEFKRLSRTFSPYLFVGVGLMGYSYHDESNMGVGMPFGIGMKVKLVERLSLDVQFANRLLFKDDLEGLAVYNDPYGLNGGNLLNNDLFSTLTVGISFDFWKRGYKCCKQ